MIGVGICVKSNFGFTLLHEYEIMFLQSDVVTATSDDGLEWFISYQGDSYYGYTDCYGKEVRFLVK